MPTEWRIRPEISRRRRFAAAPASLVITMAVALVVGWQATSVDPWRFLVSPEAVHTDQVLASTAPDEAIRSDMEQFRTEIVGLQQEIQDLNDQVRQKAAANVSANEELQNFAGQLAVEQRKSYTALEQRDSAVRQMGSLRSNLELACKLLRDRPAVAGRHSSPAAVAACNAPGI